MAPEHAAGSAQKVDDRGGTNERARLRGVARGAMPPLVSGTLPGAWVWKDPPQPECREKRLDRWNPGDRERRERRLSITAQLRHAARRSPRRTRCRRISARISTPGPVTTNSSATTTGGRTVSNRGSSHLPIGGAHGDLLFYERGSVRPVRNAPREAACPHHH